VSVAARMETKRNKRNEEEKMQRAEEGNSKGCGADFLRVSTDALRATFLKLIQIKQGGP